MGRSLLFYILMASILSSCKLQQENSAQDKQFGRLGSNVVEIADDLAKKIIRAIKKFIDNGETDEIAALIRRGGNEGAEAIAAFRKTIVEPYNDVDNRIADLHRIATSATRQNKNLDRILAPLFDDAEEALENLTLRADRYYRAVPNIAGTDYMLHKKLMVAMNMEAVWKANLADLAKFKRSSEISDKINKLRRIVSEALASSRLPMATIISSLESAIKRSPVDYFHIRFLANTGMKSSSEKAKLVKFFDDMMKTNLDEVTGFYRSFTKGSVENIEEIIYTKIPAAKSFSEIDTHLRSLVEEIDSFKVSLAERNVLIGNIFSAENASHLHKQNKAYLLEISTVGERGYTTADTSARAFGIWGNELYSKVTKWGDETGKLPTKFDLDVDVRDTFYNMQDYCRFSSC